MWKTMGILVYLLVLSVMDIKERKVNTVFFMAGILAACVEWIYGMTRMSAGWEEDLIKGLLGTLPGVFLLVIARATGKAGYADGIAMAVLGIDQGYLIGVAVLCTSLLYLSLCSAALLLFGRVKGNTQMPYFPFLTAAYMSVKLLM